MTIKKYKKLKNLIIFNIYTIQRKHYQRIFTKPYGSKRDIFHKDNYQKKEFPKLLHLGNSLC